MERAIDLSDEERDDDFSLSSSAYDLSNERVSETTLMQQGYENDLVAVSSPVVDTIGYENVLPPPVVSALRDDDAYSGYVCVRTFSAEDSSGEDEEETEELPPLDGRLAVGSGSLVSALALSERSRVQKHFSEAFAQARKRLEGETLDAQLQRALALPERRPDETTRKYALTLELIRARLAEKQEQQQPIAHSSNNDALIKLSAALSDAEQNLASTLGGPGMDKRVPELIGLGRPGLLAASYVLNHQLVQSRSGFVDWNQRFQTMLDWPETTGEEKLAKYNALMNIAKDFTFAAELVAKLIVNELSLPEPLKTVKSCSSLGGHAGGKKYVANATLFKLAQDEHGLYGSDANAQKAAGHELKVCWKAKKKVVAVFDFFVVKGSGCILRLSDSWASCSFDCNH
jgi:hypothetical protein